MQIDSSRPCPDPEPSAAPALAIAGERPVWRRAVDALADSIAPLDPAFVLEADILRATTLPGEALCRLSAVGLALRVLAGWHLRAATDGVAGSVRPAIDVFALALLSTHVWRMCSAAEREARS